MIANVITDMHFLDLAVFRQLDKKVLIDVVKVFLNLGFGKGAVGVVRGVVVDVWNEDCLGEVRLNVFPRASVTVSAGSDLEVKRTVDPR